MFKNTKDCQKSLKDKISRTSGSNSIMRSRSNSRNRQFNSSSVAAVISRSESMRSLTESMKSDNVSVCGSEALEYQDTNQDSKTLETLVDLVRKMSVQLEDVKNELKDVKHELCGVKTELREQKPKIDVKSSADDFKVETGDKIDKTSTDKNAPKSSVKIKQEVE